MLRRDHESLVIEGTGTGGCRVVMIVRGAVAVVVRGGRGFILPNAVFLFEVGGEDGVSGGFAVGCVAFGAV